MADPCLLPKGYFMKDFKHVASFVIGLAFVALPGSGSAQTPDGATPAEEQVCSDLTGVQFGLCNAICEAQDCPANSGDGVSCTKLLTNWAKHSPFFEPPCYVNKCERDCQKKAEGALEQCTKDPKTLDECEAKVMAEFDLCRTRDVCGYGCATEIDYAVDQAFLGCMEKSKGLDFAGCYAEASKVFADKYKGSGCFDKCAEGCTDEATAYECKAQCDKSWDGAAASTGVSE